MIKDHFLPIAEKLRENARTVEGMEKRLAQEKRAALEGSEDYEQFVQEVSCMADLVKSFYLSLINLLAPPEEKLEK